MKILFDGECTMCNSFTNFIRKNDTENCFQFVSLNSEEGRYWKEKFRFSHDLDTVILVIDENSFRIKSEAILEIVKFIPKLSVFRYLFFLPKRINDSIYDIIARNRHTLFPRKDSCILPTGK